MVNRLWLASDIILLLPLISISSAALTATPRVFISNGDIIGLRTLIYPAPTLIIRRTLISLLALIYLISWLFIIIRPLIPPLLIIGYMVTLLIYILVFLILSLTFIILWVSADIDSLILTISLLILFPHYPGTADSAPKVSLL